MTENINIANNFNEYFISVGSNLAAKFPPIIFNFKNWMPSRTSHSFYMLPTNNNEILSICANFESKDSAGYDEYLLLIWLTYYFFNLHFDQPNSPDV